MAGAKAFERVVIRAPNWLGDAILALPAMAAVRRALPSSELTMAGPASIVSVFRELTAAAPDQILELPSNHKAAVAALAAARFDLGILFPNSFRSAWQFYRAGVGERWGYATSGRGLLLTRRSKKAGKGGSRHQADYYRALVRGLDVECAADELPQVDAAPASVERARRLLSLVHAPNDGEIVVLLPGAAYGQAKQWPPDRMAALAARLAVERAAVCVIAGASHDRDASRAIESWLRAHAPQASGRVIDVVGRTDLHALTGLLSLASVCVSNDSGGMHLASALGRPVVAIFGPTDERATRPAGDHVLVTEPVFCRPCMLRDCPIDHRCMKRITVDRVFDAAAGRLPPALAVRA